MPKAAKAASRATHGGFGARHTEVAATLTGMRPYGPRLTAAAAVVMSRQLQELCQHQDCTLAEAIQGVLADDGCVADFLAYPLMRRAGEVQRQVAKGFLMSKVEKAASPGQSVALVAIEVRERIRSHAGPPGRMVVASEPSDGAHENVQWVLPPSSLGPLRDPPAPGSRILLGIHNWNLARLGPLPVHAVICFERAEGRVRKWRKDTGEHETAEPPLNLLKALVHTDKVPTALASEGDHYFLPALGRWAAPSEVMRLFQVPRTAPLFDALAGTLVKPARAVSILGRAVHVGSAERAVRLALSHLPFSPRTGSSRPVRYASVCSGVDMLAVAVQRVIPWAWDYVFACERDATVSSVLLAAHGQYGISGPPVIFPDACAEDATAAPAVDLWVITPPCESYSRRNHNRSHAAHADALSDLDVMLEYARNQRPLTVVVENVEEPAGVAGISAALLSIRGYAWEEFVSNAQDYGPMARLRHFWVGRRL